MSTKPSPPPVKSSPAISRRTFLATSAAAGGALVVGLTLRGRFHLPSSNASLDPFNAWIRIHPNGETQLVLNKSEMGQGVFTALPMILAEEAEAYAQRLQAAGVTVETRRYAGTIHGFFTMDRGLLPHSGQAMADIAAFIRKLL